VFVYCVVQRATFPSEILFTVLYFYDDDSLEKNSSMMMMMIKYWFRQSEREKTEN
jgi:hypothetical protein